MRAHLAPAILVALVVPSCMADPSPGTGPAGGEATGNESAAASAERPCGPLGDLRGAIGCDGFPEYLDCMSVECLDGYDACFGDAWEDDDFEGGVCTELLTCIDEAPEACSHGCVPDGACSQCLEAQLGICETYCSSLLDCAEAPQQRSCDALAVCCQGQDPSLVELCLLDLAQAEPSGDDACSGLLLAYCPS